MVFHNSGHTLASNEASNITHFAQILIIVIDFLSQPWDISGFKLLIIRVMSSSSMVLCSITLSALDRKGSKTIAFTITEH